MNDAQEKTLVALLPACLLGALLNWSILFSIRRLPSFRHSFGYLSANQALSDALHSTCFLLYFCPMVLLDSSIMKAYSRHCGFFLYLCYEVSVCTHLVMSLNRFFAAWTPCHYRKVFSDDKTKIVIILVWLYTGTTSVLFFQTFCQFYYDDVTQFLTFTATEFCGNIAQYGVFLKNAAIVAFIMVMDVTTVYKVHQSTKKLSKSLKGDSNHSKREIRFLKQTVFQGGVFMFELSTYFFVPKYFENKWAVFFATSFAWVAVHAADGIVVMIFNPEIRKFLLSRGKSIQNSSMKSRTTMSFVNSSTAPQQPNCN